MKRSATTGEKKSTAPHEAKWSLEMQKDDTELLKAARTAQSEAGSFTTAYQSVAAANGLLELLSNLIRADVEPPDDLNWSSVANLIDECSRRLDQTEAALSTLRKYERERGPWPGLIPRGSYAVAI